MFSVGLETNVQQIKEIGGPAVIITLAGVIVPMALAFLVSVWCRRLCQHDAGATACGDLLRRNFNRYLRERYGCYAQELGKLNTKVGNTIVAAAILDDIIGIIVLSIVLASRTEFRRA